jgi:hypothetical protein
MSVKDDSQIEVIEAEVEVTRDPEGGKPPAQSGTGTKSADEGGRIEDPENRKAGKSNIKSTSDDETDQIMYMIDNLNPRSKRRTLLKLQPLMSATVVDEHVPQTTPQRDNHGAIGKLHEEENTLKVGDSTITIKSISGSATGTKLRHFSGVVPVPTGQVNFRTWINAATRLCRNYELSEEEQMARIHNSLSQPALDIAQSALDSGTPNTVLKLLRNAFGSVDDPRDLLNDYNATLMDSKENPSDYLNRLHLKVEELKQCGIIKTAEGPGYLLRQFIYGCVDDTLILKLRLEEKEDNPPDYGTLLLALRKEEAKRSKRQMAQKYAHSQQVSIEGEKQVDGLKKEVEHLKAQLANIRPTKQESVKQSSSQSTPSSKKEKSEGQRPATKKKLRFCFKCGETGHVVWTCKNQPNPALVCQKFEDAQQEN